MEGPTPVSALIHAATMVTAGVYLLIRINTIFSFSFITNIVIFIGALTALNGALMGIYQNDIKKIIAYSCSESLNSHKKTIKFCLTFFRKMSKSQGTPFGRFDPFWYFFSKK